MDREVMDIPELAKEHSFFLYWWCLSLRTEIDGL
jgi:hypothetical protein